MVASPSFGITSIRLALPPDGGVGGLYGGLGWGGGCELPPPPNPSHITLILPKFPSCAMHGESSRENHSLPSPSMSAVTFPLPGKVYRQWWTCTSWFGLLSSGRQWTGFNNPQSPLVRSSRLLAALTV